MCEISDDSLNNLKQIVLELESYQSYRMYSHVCIGQLHGSD